MDTKVTGDQNRTKQAWFSHASLPHQDPCWWFAILCVLVCGCALLKPTPAAQTAAPPAATKAAQSTDQISASPPPQTATPTPGPTPPVVQTSIVDPLPAPALRAPALNPATPILPSRSAQNLVVPGSSTKVQMSHAVTNSVAYLQIPQTTVTYMPREAAAAIVIKGPPRQPEPQWSRIAVPLCLGMGLGAALVALVLGSRRRFKVHSGHKARRQELFLPSEFKLRTSAIQPEAPLGMLAPEKQVRRSKMGLLVSVLASTTNAIRFLVSKLPLERVGTSCRAAWQRVSAPLPAIPEPCSSEPLAPGAADSKCAEGSEPAAPQSAPPGNEVQGKPTESQPSHTPATSVVPVKMALEAPTLEPKAADKSSDEAAIEPSQACKEAPVRVS